MASSAGNVSTELLIRPSSNVPCHFTALTAISMADAFLAGCTAHP